MDLKVFLSFDLPTYTFGQFQKQTYKRFTSSNIKKIFVLSNQEMRYQKGSDTIQNVSGRFDHRDRTKILHADLVRNFQASWAHQSTVSTYLGEHLKTGISLGIVLSYSIPKSLCYIAAQSYAYSGLLHTLPHKSYQGPMNRRFTY